ncbi:MAG: ABC transporter ATP-binding protein [Deltaproteobacteria bacterium]|nr:ABC transporter ATP-binding protein [Deltaproteobacteria bacterium]
MTDSILALRDVHTHIQQHHILQGVSLEVKPGRATVLVGRNGAGKSTTLRTIMGLNPATSGTIEMEGQPIQQRKPYEIAHLGIGYVPEDNAVLYTLTVEENLRLAMFQESEQGWSRLETIFHLFPDLKRFLHSKAGILSGGQKQMLAIALALVRDHRLVLIDEPSKGLAPVVVEHLGESLNRIKEKTTVVLVEQNFYLASLVGQDYFILDDGRVVHQGLMAELVEDRELKQKYLGIADGGLACR